MKIGDLACFVPADSMVPVARHEFSFLADKAGVDGYARVRGIRLRKIPSVGLLVRAPDVLVVPQPPDANGESRSAYLPVRAGDDLSGWYGIKKYEPPQTHSFFTNSDAEKAPDDISRTPVYDVENLWQYDGAVIEGTSIEALDYVDRWSIT